MKNFHEPLKNEDATETAHAIPIPDDPLALDDAYAEVARMVTALLRVEGGRIEGATPAATLRVRALAHATLAPLTQLQGELLQQQRLRCAGKVVTA